MIRVFESQGRRDAIPSESLAVARVLELFGHRSSASDNTTSLGDALAAIGVALGLDAAGDVVVVGRVDEGGAVVQEDGVEISSLVRCGAPSFVVPEVGPCAAEAVRAGLPGQTKASVRGVSTLAEAADYVFSLLERARNGELVAPAARAAAQAALFDGIVAGNRLALDWTLLTAIAIGLLRNGSDDERSRFELAFVRDVARRHDGGTDVIGWPDEELASYPQPKRARILAHVVQSAADGALHMVGEYVTKARRELAALDPELTDALAVRGAIGRALAAVGRFAEAEVELGATVEAWLERDPAQASFALCEQLRVAGIERQESRVRKLLEVAERVEAHTSAYGRTYVALACGRALVQVGSPRLARDVLAAPSVGMTAPAHVRAASLRWLARAMDDLGDGGAADSVRRELGDRHANSDQLALAKLDRATTVTERQAGLELLLGSAGSVEAKSLLERIAPGLSPRAFAERPALVVKVREEYRY